MNFFRSKFTLLVLFLLPTAYLFSQTNNPNAIDIRHYEFNISVNDNNDVIEGAAVIQFHATEPVKNIQLDLGSIKPDGKGMKVISVSSESTGLAFNHSNDKLNITLPSTLKKDDSTQVTIRYSGIPVDGLIISKSKYQRRTFFADNWPRRAHFWLPCKDDLLDKATVDFNVTAPAHYQVISNGIQIEVTGKPKGMRLTRYEESSEIPTKIMVIGIADFSSQLISEVEGIPISAWVYEEDRALARHAYGSSADALQFMIKNVGPYPYRKLANVQSKTIFGGLENANTIFYYENSVDANINIESTVMHEVSHQWFGDNVTETAFEHLWLSEGFATYMEHLYIGSRYGEDSLKQEMALDRLKVIDYSQQSSAPVVDLQTKNYMDLLNVNSYQKGSWVLHMLRQQVGDSIFWKGIRNYYKLYAGKNASTEDFKKVMESVSGQQLEQFFKQWLYTGGQPQLDISYSYKNKQLEVKITQKQQALFSFTLPMNIVTSDQGILTKSTRVSERSTSFSIPLNSAPQKIVADPNTTLLFEATISRSN